MDPSGFDGEPHRTGTPYGPDGGSGSSGGPSDMGYQAYAAAMQQAVASGDGDQQSYLQAMRAIEASQEASAQAANAAQVAGTYQMEGGGLISGGDSMAGMGSLWQIGGGSPESGGTTAPASGPMSEVGATGSRPGSGSGSGGAGNSPQGKGAPQSVSGTGQAPQYVASMTPGERFVLTLPLSLCLAGGAISAAEAGAWRLLSSSPSVVFRMGPVLGYGLPGAGAGAKGVSALVNAANHLFGSKSLARHNLGGFLSTFGGDKVAAFNALQTGVQQLANQGLIGGLYQTTVVVMGQAVTVRGAVVEGVAKVGTAFIP